MNPTTLLLNAYYERLFELLELNRLSILAQIEELLAVEASKIPVNLDKEKLSALKEVSLALLEERIEMYNPIGIQYTFERLRTEQARQLELQLDWFDSQQEFEELLQAIRNKIETDMEQSRILELADELIRESGAFPDESIIKTYKQKPGINKLPDYIVALAIEKNIK
jgi:predicted transcriptional regulator